MENLKQITGRDKDYSVRDGATNENIQLSCLMRIADASEAMAKNYTQMQDELAMYIRKFKAERLKVEDLERQLKAQKGAKTRFKNKLNAIENEMAIQKT